jgi:hypothetical protein
MRSYLQHRKTLAIFLGLNMVFEIMLYIYLFSNMNYMIAQLGEIYKEMSIEKLATVFCVCNGIDILINIFVYTFGFYALYTHKITFYNLFNGALVIAVFSRIIISYLNM